MFSRFTKRGASLGRVIKACESLNVMGKVKSGMII